MAEHPEQPPIDVDALRATFSDWRIFQKDDSWFALRRGEHVEFLEGPRSLLRHVHRAEDLSVLAHILTVQAFLDALSDADLAEVWRQADLGCVASGSERASAAEGEAS